MARLQLANIIYVSKGLLSAVGETSYDYRVLNLFRQSLDKTGHRCNTVVRFSGRKAWERERDTVVQCCNASAAATSADHQEVGIVASFDDDNVLDRDEGQGGELHGEGKGQFGYLVREYGWEVRRLDEEDQGEIRRVAQVQAQAFHVPVLLFDDLFFQFFQAEVLSGLLYRLRNSPPSRYACLVAESNLKSSKQVKELVGVVDVTVQRDDAVLEHLPGGAQEYLYVSGIAVLTNFRRKKVATALLKACDVLSTHWGFEYLVLRAYDDDWGALKLYAKAGYRIVSGDPPWMTSWIGRKRRVLLTKSPSLSSL